MPGTTALPDGATITRHLARLTAAYPAFAFSREPFGWKGARWVAERRDRAATGLRVLITDDLLELHAALARDRDRRRAVSAAGPAPAAAGSGGPGRRRPPR